MRPWRSRRPSSGRRVRRMPGNDSVTLGARAASRRHTVSARADEPAPMRSPLSRDGSRSTPRSGIVLLQHADGQRACVRADALACSADTIERHVTRPARSQSIQEGSQNRMGKHSQRRTPGGATTARAAPKPDRAASLPSAAGLPASTRRQRRCTATPSPTGCRTLRRAAAARSSPRPRGCGSSATGAAPERRRSRSRARGGLLVAASWLQRVGVFAYAKHLERTMQPTIVEKEKLDSALTKAKPMEPFNILILGADYRKGDTAYRTDSMMVAHVDPKAEEGLAAVDSARYARRDARPRGAEDQRRSLLRRPRRRRSRPPRSSRGSRSITTSRRTSKAS